MQVIVLHHFVSYGPLAEAVRVLFPALVIWLYDYGRVAVQVFLVIGGYLAARVLSPHGEAFRGKLWSTLVNRYLRLTPPYVFALALAMLCAVFARHWIDDSEFVPAVPGIGQALAHLFLLHDLFDYDALSAGVWYVAIDFQLFAVLATLLWLSARVSSQVSRVVGSAQVISIGGVLLLSIASLLWFNRDQDYDIWAVYFFAAYGLGAITYWAEKRASKGNASALFALRLLWLAIVCALIFDFRWRLLLALATALALHITASHTLPLHRPVPRWVHALAHISYALFLIHFPIYMLVSALFVKYGLVFGPWSALIGIAATWLASLAAAFALHRWIEMPASRLRVGKNLRLRPATQP